MFDLLQPKIRYTDTCLIITEQWEKGSEKLAFPNVYAYNYNRKKFENLAKLDEKDATFSTKLRRRFIPVKRERKESKEEIIPITNAKNHIVADYDEPDFSEQTQTPQTVLSPPKIIRNEEDDSSDDPVNEIEPVSATDETTPAIFIDSSSMSNDATLRDRSPLSFETFDTMVWLNDDANDDYSAIDLTEIIVDIHNDPDCIVLEIREDDEIEKSYPKSTSPHRESSLIAKVSKERDLEDVPESEHEQIDENLETMSETTANDVKEQIVCDINENIIVRETKIDEENIDIVVDHNDNNIKIESEPVKHSERAKVCVQKETDATIVKAEAEEMDQIIVESTDEPSPSNMKRHDFRRISDSSRSSYDESDGIDSEPSYASIDKCKIAVS